MLSMWICFDHTYLVASSRSPQILLLQETTRSMRSRGLCPTRRQEAGLYTKSDGEGIMPQRIAGWGKKIWLLLQTSYEPISLGIVFDSFDLLLTSGAYGTPGACPWTLQNPLSERVYFSWGMFLASWARPTGVRTSFCFLLFGLFQSTLVWVIL